MISPRPGNRPLAALAALAALAFLALVFFQTANAQETGDPVAPKTTVWGALVYGNPEDIRYGGIVPDDFPAVVESLRADFDHSHFSLLSDHTHPVVRKLESWVIPAKDLFLKIDSAGPTTDGRGLRLHLQIWEGKKILLKADAILTPDSPLILSGPAWQKGQLFAVLKLEHDH